jgi:protein-S-isoprenylcysteine O-methyltransferase Ste14
MKKLVRKLEIPPLWLAAFIVNAWWLSANYTMDLSFGPVWADLLGGLLIGGGLLIILMAAAAFYRAKTTLMPRSQSSSFVQSGIYKRSRNPIYLGDAMILAGLILYWDAVLALPLIPLFVWIIEKRFIIGEEKHLRIKYRAAWGAYERKVRRWL